MELAHLIARVTQPLDLTPISEEVPQPVGMVVNHPKGGAPFIITPRHLGVNSARPRAHVDDRPRDRIFCSQR